MGYEITEKGLRGPLMCCENQSQSDNFWREPNEKALVDRGKMAEVARLALGSRTPKRGGQNQKAFC